MRSLHTLFAVALCTAAACSTPTTQAQPATPVLAPESGALTVTSEPPGAIVIIDGKRAGRTPLTIQSPVGTHMVVLQRDGHNYGPHPVAISVDKPASLTVNVSAKPDPKPDRRRKQTAGQRYESDQRRLALCFPKGWAGEKSPETVIARASLNDSGRLVRMTIDHPSAGYAIERCVEAVLRPKYETRDYTEGIDRTNITITIILR